MILKKPYAFLIKNFRLIHLILTVPLIYITYKTTAVSNFFREYVANNYSSTINGNFSNIFVNNLMYFSILIILLGTIAVYLLFKYKEKPRNNYIAIIIYYMILFVLLNVCHGILDVMEMHTIEASLARTYRDISLLLLIPQYYFCGFTILRSLGFNIKKLNFADDLKELEISEKDNEEFEFVVGVEGYKAKRKFRRFLREFSYYIKENTFIFIALVLIAIISIGTSIYIHKDDYEINYKQKEKFAYKNFTISIEDSILTNLSYNGQKISKDKHYLVLKMNLINNSTKNIKLDYTDFKILIKNKFISPTIDKGAYFIDYANPYEGKRISPQKEESYVLVYEINEEQIADTYNLKIYNGVTRKKKELKSKYFNILLTPVLVDETKEVRSVGLNEQLDFTSSNIGDTKVTIKNYEITTRYVYEYENCHYNNCQKFKSYISADQLSTSQSKTLLVLHYDLELSTNTKTKKHFDQQMLFFSDFISLRYKMGDKTYKVNLKNVTPFSLKNTEVFEINKKIEKAKKIELLFTIRNKIYSVKLK